MRSIAACLLRNKGVNTSNTAPLLHWKQDFPRIISERSFSTSTDSVAKLVDWKIDTANPHIGYLTLQSPQNYNALTVELGREFSHCVRDIIHNVLPVQDIRVIVLTGQGKAFSAGGNLDWLRSLKENSVHANADAMITFYNYFLCIRQVPVPVIAAMNGPAMGAGAGLALACDLRVAQSQHSILGLHFTKLGIHTGMGSSHLLKQVLPSTTALNEILLAGKILSGKECLDLGIVNRLASGQDSAVGIAHNMATDLAERHPVALRMLVQTLRAQQDEGLQQALQREALAQAICYSRNDWGEGVNAIAEKRKPNFDGYHEK